MASSIKARIQADMVAAMKAKEKERLETIRYIMAALKQKEVDERIELDDSQIITVLDKLAKRHRESISQFEQANRQDLVNKETFELEIVQTYLPKALSDAEINQLIEQAIQTSSAQSIKDMGKVMAILKPQIQGRTDMALVSDKIKQKLS